jgi:two-component system, NtrC family, response regulator AtoC
VDDDKQTRRVLSATLESWNYNSLEAGTIADAAQILQADNPPVILLDIQLPDGSGLDFLSEIKKDHRDTVVVIITGNVDVHSTISALRGGAHDFIEKPIRLEELRVTLRNALELRQLRRVVEQTRLERQKDFSFAQIIGESDCISKAKELAEKVAASSVNAVLLQGETGTGKDLFALAIHYASERTHAPYLAINCAALPANLIESELFGYEKGAFTDAKSRKEGLFEQAHGGTIFLDEIGEMELGLQAKLLRVLEESTFRRVGGLKDIPVDARVIAASNKNLKDESERGTFRLDLYYRLSVIQIDIPPLRRRGDDVLLLARHYIQKTNHSRRGKPIKELTPEAEKIFKHYGWAGNVRELRNVIERASILEDGEFITTKYLPSDMVGENEYAETNNQSLYILPPGGVSLEEVENDFVHQAIAKTGGNITRAANLLNISRDQMRYRLKKAGVEDFVEA